MKINHIHIQNFRKLKNCRIDFDENQTILVGANNSGKTSAISAMIWLLSDNGKKKFSTREFTLSNWSKINDIGNEWLANESIDDSLLKADKWEMLVPALDVWIDVKETETYLVNHIIPSLTWDGKMVGFRVRFEPLDIKALYTDYKEAIEKADTLKATEEWHQAAKIELFPKNLWDFLYHGNNLGNYFGIKYYVLDSTKIPKDENCVQSTPEIDITEDPSKGLIYVDSIMAFREFSDPEGAKDNDIDTLSRQLQEYYRINNKTEEEDIEIGDLELMSKLEQANKSYDDKLQKSFENPIRELSAINYPGFQNPDITIQSKINIENAISHESAV